MKDNHPDTEPQQFRQDRMDGHLEGSANYNSLAERVEQLEKALRKAQRELGIQREMTLATKYAVIDTVGGVDYEGHPTGTLNYLQRLRILVEKERLFDTVSKNSDEWRAKFEQAQRENDATIEALEQKIKALAPHGTCACSYDSPTDKCLHHSPALVKLTERNAALESVLVKVDRISWRFPTCPFCDGLQWYVDANGERVLPTNRHKDGCQLKSALGSEA